MSWKPSNEPVRNDPHRVADFEPVSGAIEKLGLPLIRFRKLNGICNAIAMQIEDGGDSPAVDDLLLDALRAAVLHQVGEKAATPVLGAIKAFQGSEAKRWEKIRSGVPLPVSAESQIDELVKQGYGASQQKNTRAACDHWLAAWQLVRQLAQPDIRTAHAFWAHYGLAAFLENWAQELIFELQNAGAGDPRSHEKRLKFAREYLAQFPDEDTIFQVNFMRA